MKTIYLVSEQQGLEENPFAVSTFRGSASRSTSVRRHFERSAFASRGTQPPLATSGVEASPLFRSPQLPSQFSVQPSLGLADELCAFYVSERLTLSPKLYQRFAELFTLQPGWDGGTAIPPRPEVLAHIAGLLIFMKAALAEFQEPFLAPTISGFAQLEWHNDPRLLEFEATTTGWSILGCETTARGDRAYHEGETARFDVENLMAAYRWFEGAELLWPIL